MKKIKNKSLTFLVSLLCFGLFAQENSYIANLKNDSIAGYKKIVLTPKLQTISNSDFSDLRLLDANNQQVPYFIQSRNFKFLDAEFIAYKHNIYYTKSQTSVIVNNPKNSIYYSFTLKLSNANVSKKCKIEGSNDAQKWFVISERLYLNLSKNTTKGFNYYTVSFPAVDYNHIRLVINDSVSAPLHIKDVGFLKYNKVIDEEKYQSLKYSHEITQKEKTTSIHITATDNFEINKFDIYIDSPSKYDRNAVLYYLNVGSKKDERREIKRFNLSSKDSNVFKNLNIKQKEFWIEVDNKDNQPLSIFDINFYQKEKYLVADLKPNQQYTIVVGNKELSKPSYDLVNFIDEIEYNLPSININKETKNKEKSVEVKKIPFYQKPWFMWTCIGLVGITILIFTMSLFKKAEKL
ncbi:MAG: hypothetical protein L3J08_08585 [Flavobacteriaceae bacterium]|nr:hypothetical protein [Flavobacteriaceae bacterium]